MSLELDFNDAARTDYLFALDWYRRRSHRTALRFKRAVQSALDSIVADPLRFAKISGTRRYCVLRVFPYSVIFRETPNSIRVLAIAHHSRRKYWLRRK